MKLGQFFISRDRDVTKVADALDVRDHLEILLARHAATYATKDDLRDLYDILDVINEPQNPTKSHLQAIWSLHARICEISPNEVLRVFYLGLLSFIEKNVDDKTSSKDKDAAFIAQRFEIHARLVNAIASGSPDTAAAEAASHNEALAARAAKAK